MAGPPAIESLTAALRQVQDPHLAQNVVDLGLVYNLQVDDRGHASVIMTLTTPHHPAADQIADAVREAVEAVSGVNDVMVALVWEPAWSPYRMAAPLKAALGLPAEEPDPPAPVAGRAGELDPLRRLWRRLRSF